MKREFILGYPKQFLLSYLARACNRVGYGAAQLYTPIQGDENGFKAFADLFDGLTAEAFFKRREELEKSHTEIHPIPYLIYRRQDGTVYDYQRGKLIEEERLAGDDSVGIGGHPEIKDACDGIQFVPYLHAFAAALEKWSDYGVDLQTMITAIIREAYEEVRLRPATAEGRMLDLDTNFGFRFIGALYDESNDVGLRHLGLVFEVSIPNNQSVESKETIIEDRGFFLPEKLILENADGVKRLENWSHVVLQHLIAEKTAKANNA
jgi:predicted NUDIX family phosphoesterase